VIAVRVGRGDMVAVVHAESRGESRMRLRTLVLAVSMHSRAHSSEYQLLVQKAEPREMTVEKTAVREYQTFKSDLSCRPAQRLR
jgi:hypothetical protein